MKMINIHPPVHKTTELAADVHKNWFSTDIAYLFMTELGSAR